MKYKTRNADKDAGIADISYKHCLNCGSKLKGRYCHACGQQATSTTPTIRGIIMEYFYNAMLWEPKSLRTIWLLIRRPGFLTKEFLSGRYVSHVHPLKLNMFMLFVFVTLFMLFSGTENASIQPIADDEETSPVLQMELITNDLEYAECIKASPRDTIQLAAPLLLAEMYPEMFTNLERTEDVQSESNDKWTAIIPRRMIEDSIVISGVDGYYTFNPNSSVNKDIELVYNIWDRWVGFSTRYFPIIILLTIPLLSFSLRLVQRKHKQTRINRFIFSLHYTAFIEAVIIFIYLLYLIIAPPISVLQWVLIIASCTYLTMAFRQVYVNDSWRKAIIKSIYTTLVYILVILFMFICLFIAITIIALF